MKCPRCGDAADKHWPEHGRPTTACVACLDASSYTADPVTGQVGICCYPADLVNR